jgi:hypothetical protein
MCIETTVQSQQTFVKNGCKHLAPDRAQFTCYAKKKLVFLLKYMSLGDTFEPAESPAVRRSQNCRKRLVTSPDQFFSRTQALTELTGYRP